MINIISHKHITHTPLPQKRRKCIDCNKYNYLFVAVTHCKLSKLSIPLHLTLLSARRIIFSMTCCDSAVLCSLFSHIFCIAISFNDDSYEEEKKGQNICVIPWYHSVLKPQREQESRYGWSVGAKCNSRLAWLSNWLVTYNTIAKASFIFIFFATCRYLLEPISEEFVCLFFMISPLYWLIETYIHTHITSTCIRWWQTHDVRDSVVSK